MFDIFGKLINIFEKYKIKRQQNCETYLLFYELGKHYNNQKYQVLKQLMKHV